MKGGRTGPLPVLRDMNPTFEQIQALFCVCRLCKKQAHAKSQHYCDECLAKLEQEAYTDVIGGDRVYGS